MAKFKYGDRIVFTESAKSKVHPALADKVYVVKIGDNFSYSDGCHEVQCHPEDNVSLCYYWKDDLFDLVEPDLVDDLRKALDALKSAGYTVGPVQVTEPGKTFTL